MLKKIKGPYSVVYLMFVIALAWYGIGTLQNCSADQGTSKQLPLEERFVGDEACQRCHEQEYDDWFGSHHDLAMAEANEETVLGDFGGTTLLSKGITSRFFKKGDKFFVNTEGPDGTPEDFEVLYTFGAEPLQQYMIRFPGGRLQCLHTAWDTEKKEWFDLQPDEQFQPGDWMHWTKGSMTWNLMCADCHSTYLRKNYDPEAGIYDTEWSIIDVSCEACHGPGKEHLEYINSKSYQRGKKVPGSFMDQTFGIPSKQQVDECARCHSFRSQRTLAFDHEGKFMDHYVPEVLRPNLYHLDGQIMEEVYVYGSFLQSKMYRHQVKCTNCHNPHSLELVAIGNDLCGQCHVKTTYDTPDHHFHPVDGEGAQCINCHMPGKIYMGNDYRRDHSFRVPRPDLSVRYGTPNACNQCHTDQSADWAAKAVENWYGPERQPHFSDILTAAHSGDPAAIPGLVEMVGDTSQAEIARATAVWLLGDLQDPETFGVVINALKNPDPLIRYTAVNAIEGQPPENKLRYLAPLLTDSIRSVRTQAAYILADVPEQLFVGETKVHYQTALNEYEEVMLMQSDFSGGQLMIGQFHHKRNELEQAESAYRKALEIDQVLSQPNFMLANLYYQQGAFQKAEAEFLAVIQKDSLAADAYYRLGLLQAELNRLEDSQENLKKAALISGNPRYFYNWGLSLQHLERPAEAEKAYLQGISINPDSQANLYAIAILYLQQGQPLKARPAVQRLLQLDPNNPQYRRLFESMNQ